MPTSITIREATADDAEAIIAHVLRLADEPNKMVAVSPGEFTITVEQERQLLADYAAAATSIYLVAEVEGQLAGVLSCQGSNRAVKRHVAGIGISVGAPWRGQGVGDVLMKRTVEWAKENPALSRLELDVYEHNVAAICLYKKHGFLVEGVKQRAYFQEGRFIDSVLMGLVW